MTPNDAAAIELMSAFAERTGLSSDRPPRRYLWTDAFAVCNYLGLARSTGDARFADLAQRLVDQVHQVLGRHRADAAHTGWLSGLDEQAGAAHPTRGGLRIGKPLPERRPDEPFDELLEWDRDGQYFHYLTKWMHALDQVARATRQPRFNLWARELADTAHRAFSYGGAGQRAMTWKVSTDLSRALVPSMGQHDPLDGQITCVQLQATATELGGAPTGPDMTDLAADFAAMIAGRDLATTDPLGLGGLLADAGRVAQLLAHGAFADGDLLDIILASALAGLTHHARRSDVHQPASRRLAFRELGLAIGLHALATIRDVGNPRTAALLSALAPHVRLGTAIESFWLDPAHRQDPTWSEHADINDVMLAASLAPSGFVTLPRLD